MVTGSQPSAGLVPDQFVMEVPGLGVSEQGLQETVHMSGGKEIFAPGDQGDALLGIVHHYCEMVGSGYITAGEDNVAQFPWEHGPRSTEEIVEGELSVQFCCSSGIEAPRMRMALGDSVGPFVVTEAATGSGIEGAFRAVGSIGHPGDFLCDGTTVAEAGVSNPLVPELVEGTGIVLHPAGLAHCFSLPPETQPAEILLDQRVILGPNPGMINVFKAQETRSPVVLRQLVGDQGGIGMAKVQPAGGAGCKAGQHGKSLGVQVGGFKLSFVRA